MGKKIPDARTGVVISFLRWLDSSPHLQHLSWYSRFRSVIELWFAAATRNEAEYQSRVTELSPDAVRNGATEHFARMQLAMAQEPQDLLGEAYQAYAVRDTRNLAQYFTPGSVAKAMAAMTFADTSDVQWRKPGGCRVLEPSCGSGVMVIHALEEIRRKYGQWALNRTQVVLCDIDPLCLRMAVLQLFWYPAVIGSVVLLLGNSLTGEQEVMAVFGKGIAPTFERIIRKPEVEGGAAL